MRMGLVALLLVLLAGQVAADPAERAQPTASDEKNKLETVTVNAKRRAALERQVKDFVYALAVKYWHDSLSRWNKPVCPLVGGLPREQGEFVLARVSQVAKDSGIPLAAEDCRPNLYIIVTPDPTELLEKWWARDRGMYDRRKGIGPIRAFIESGQPIRAWYNMDFSGSDGSMATTDTTGGTLGLPTLRIADASRLNIASVKSYGSVVVIADADCVKSLTMGQLADYVTFIGLAEVHLDADTGATPSILNLFADAGNAPRELSSWDLAYLRSMYDTNQGSVFQTSFMKARMVEIIAP